MTEESLKNFVIENQLAVVGSTVLLFGVIALIAYGLGSKNGLLGEVMRNEDEFGH